MQINCDVTIQHLFCISHPRRHKQFHKKSKREIKSIIGEEMKKLKGILKRENVPHQQNTIDVFRLTLGVKSPGTRPDIYTEYSKTYAKFTILRGSSTWVCILKIYFNKYC